MRAIELKVLEGEPAPEDAPEDAPPQAEALPFRYLENIRGLMKSPLNIDLQTGRPIGVDIERLRKIDRLWVCFEDKNDGDVVNLEDADYGVLMQLVTAFRYQFYEPRVVMFLNDLNDAPEVDIEEGPAANP